MSAASSNLSRLRIPVVYCWIRLLGATSSRGHRSRLMRVLLEGSDLALVGSGEVILYQTLTLPSRDRWRLSLLSVHRAHDSALPSLRNRVCRARLSRAIDLLGRTHHGISLRLARVSICCPLLQVTLRIKEVEDHGLHSLWLLRVPHLLKLMSELIDCSSSILLTIGDLRVPLLINR